MDFNIQNEVTDDENLRILLDILQKSSRNEEIN
jgi:hypothetical protein